MYCNFFDNIIEGVCYKNVFIIFVQYYLESSLGFKESYYIFKEFVELLKDFQGFLKQRLQRLKSVLKIDLNFFIKKFCIYFKLVFL